MCTKPCMGMESSSCYNNNNNDNDNDNSNNKGKRNLRENPLDQNRNEREMKYIPFLSKIVSSPAKPIFQNLLHFKMFAYVFVFLTPRHF